MRFIAFLSLVCLLVVALVGCGGGPLWTKTITITQQQIEDKMVGKFPMHKENRLIKSDFSNPKVHLTAGSDRVTFGLDVEIEFLRDTYTGHLLMSAGLEYVSKKGSFYLVDSQIETLTIGGLSQSKSDKIGSAQVGHYQRRSHRGCYRNLDIRPVSNGTGSFILFNWIKMV